MKYRTRDVARILGWSRRDARQLLRYMDGLALEEQAWNLATIVRTRLSARMVLGACEVAKSGESCGVVSDGWATVLVDVRQR